MRRTPPWASRLAASALSAALACGCSLALDFDSLTAGSGGPADSGDTDTGPECTVDPDCADAHGCTTDRCDEKKGVCQHIPDNTGCAPLEKCDPQDGCVPTGRECLVNSECDDGVSCTVDVCGSNGKCRRTPDSERCVDTDNPCLIGSTCDPVSDCVGGHEMACDQPDPPLPCQRIVCDPANGECGVVEPVDGADDDSDSHFDAVCGGDDCDDTKPEIHPGARETCNYTDDGCDGFADLDMLAGPAAIAQAEALSSPWLAFDGTRFAAVWQRGAGAESTVYFQLLGTGSCLTQTTCSGSGDRPASEAVNFTAAAVQGGFGESPRIAATAGGFTVVWAASDAATSPAAYAVDVAYDDAASAVTLGTAEALPGTGDPAIVRLAAASLPGGGWAAAYAETSAAPAVTTVWVVVNDTASGASPPLAAAALAGTAGGIGLACLSAEDCAVAFSLEGDTGAPSAEVYETRLAKSGADWSVATGYPRVASPASASGDDPSADPVVAAADGRYVVAFTDVRWPDGAAAPEAEADIRAIADGELRNLFDDNDKGFDQRLAGLVRHDVHFGLLFVQEMGAERALGFRLLDEALARLPNQGSTVARDHMDDLEAGPLVRAAAGFAAVWVEISDDGNDVLRFARFAGCAGEIP